MAGSSWRCGSRSPVSRSSRRRQLARVSQPRAALAGALPTSGPPGAIIAPARSASRRAACWIAAWTWWWRLDHRSISACGTPSISKYRPPRPGPALDREPERREFAGELGAVRGADLALVHQPRARVDRHHPPVAAHRGVQQHVGVQLRIRACSSTARAVVCRQLVATTPAAFSCTTCLVDALADHRHLPVAYSSARSIACSCARSIRARSSGSASAQAALTDFGAENVASIAATASPLAAGASQLLTGVRPADRHQRAQLLTGHRPLRSHPTVADPADPPSRRLDPLPVLEVVVAQLRGLRLALQILRVRRRRRPGPSRPSAPAAPITSTRSDRLRPSCQGLQHTVRTGC